MAAGISAHAQKHAAEQSNMRVAALPLGTDVTVAFPAWVAERCVAGHGVVLDVGAGRGLHACWLDGHAVDCRIVGVDPDPGVLENPYLDEAHCTTLAAFAADPAHQGRFDVAYAAYVVEHVTDPAAFFAACASLLAPGGTLYVVTPNLWHPFGLASHLAATVKIQDRALARLLGWANGRSTHAGAQARDRYHFPTAYRANSVRALARLLPAAGFRDMEFRCFDRPRSMNYVVPPVLRWAPRLYARAIYALGAPRLMGTLMVRATLPPDASLA